MNIISTTFFVSFVAFFAIYWLLEKKHKIQNVYVLLASYAFYALLDWRFCGLLFFTSLITFYSGIAFEKITDVKIKKIIFFCEVIINIGILFVFKYYNFFAGEFARFLSLNRDIVMLNLILPVGISFYTFTAIGYTIDVYKGKTLATKKIVPFLNFISFFPLLLSGPIERSTGLLQQFKQDRKFDYALMVDGVQQIIWGVFKKAVLADNCAMVINNAFGNYLNLPASSLAIGAILYSFQIYFDFSGYSDIAIGLSKLLGFRIRINFHFPYFALNVSDFWRRWHMSLQGWFTDYIYYPLGGSRCSKGRTIFNTFVVFAVCGIWHGANWTFILWGLYHAMLFVPLVLFGSKSFRKKIVNENKVFPTFNELLLMFTNFGLITIGWIIFNSISISSAIGYLRGICSSSLFSAPIGIGLDGFIYVFALLIVAFAFEWTQRSKEHAMQFNSSGKVKVLIMYILIVHVIFCKAAQSDFIYYQF